MKLVFVDDSDARKDVFKAALNSSPVAELVKVIYCDSADQARLEMLTFADLLILDILLPKKVSGTPQAKHSVELLKDVCNPHKRYIRPKLIIGLTADVSEMKGYSALFAQEASIVLEGTASNETWVGLVLEQIEKLIGAQQKVNKINRDSILVSIHGIRTYGRWQTELTQEIEKYYRELECIEMKYGFFDLVSFAIPFLRNRKVSAAATYLTRQIESYDGREIYIIAHSFGTLIAAKVLTNLSNKRVNCVIFCGSPLPSDYDLDPIMKASIYTVNDCGTSDHILLLAKIFIWGLGDAGRSGFSRANSDSFCNRYFSGGHDLYFKPYGKDRKFFNRFWLDLFTIKGTPERFDIRENYFGEDIFDLTLKFLKLIKPLLCILPLAIIIALLLLLVLTLINSIKLFFI